MHVTYFLRATNSSGQRLALDMQGRESLILGQRRAGSDHRDLRVGACGLFPNLGCQRSALRVA